jgi:hypothetical protein
MCLFCGHVFFRFSFFLDLSSHCTNCFGYPCFLLISAQFEVETGQINWLVLLSNCIVADMLFLSTDNCGKTIRLRPHPSENQKSDCGSTRIGNDPTTDFLSR